MQPPADAELPTRRSTDRAAEEIGAGDGVNLRLWFACYLGWLIALTGASLWGLSQIDGGGSPLGWCVWILAGYAFYLSLCCTFLPAPTTWIVMLAASDMVAASTGFDDHALLRLITVATIGAAASGVANLNEYHVFVYLLRKHRVAKLRQTRLYARAIDWFHASPFWLLTLFSFLPIPVDVIRWLAITARYSRKRFFWANFIGRWFRYAIWALAALGLQLTAAQIMMIQVVLVVIALLRFTPRIIKRWRGRKSKEPSNLLGV